MDRLEEIKQTLSRLTEATKKQNPIIADLVWAVAEIERLQFCPLLHTRCGACGQAIWEDGHCGCEDNMRPMGALNRDRISKLQAIVDTPPRTTAACNNETISRAIREVLLEKEFLKEFAEAFASTPLDLEAARDE